MFNKRFNPLRIIKTFKLRILRQRDSAHAIARGAVIGSIIGMIIPIGGQTFLAIFLAWIFKANKLASFLFTTISNPWSAVIIYPIQIALGGKILRYDIEDAVINHFLEALSQVEVFKLNFTPLVNYIKLYGWEILGSFVVGGAIIGIILSFIFYPLMIRAVNQFNIQRQKRIELREKKRREKLMQLDHKNNK